MKKIEDAARAWANSKAAGDNFTSAHGDFIAGARYVLDQLTSEAMSKIGAANGQRCSQAMAGGVLRAARRGIEG